MSPAPAGERLVLPVSERDHVQGPAAAPVTIVEYADFQCPHCGQASGHLASLRNELPDTLRLVFRHFPLWDSHPLAGKAAEAAEAAGAQGRFWEMHEKLFKRQDELDEDDLVKAAKKIGLDMKRFQRELREGFHAPRVRADWLAGQRSGVRGTPTLFINGQRYRGSWEFDALVQHLVRLTRGDQRGE